MFSRESYTLNFDGSHNNQANKVGAGCIIRDSEGQLIVAAAYNLTKTDLPCYNVAIAEAVGLRNGLRLAKNFHYKLNVIKGDNKEVIDHVLGRATRQPGPGLTGIIAEIKGMLAQGFVEIKLIDREDNKVADMFASMGSMLPTEFRVFTKYDYDLPFKVTELINKEKVRGTRKERDEEEESSLASNIAKAVAVVAKAVAVVIFIIIIIISIILILSGETGAVVAGVAMLAWGLSKLLSGETSSSSSSFDQPKIKSQANEVQKTWDTTLTNNNAVPDFFTLQYIGSDRNQILNAGAGCMIKNRGEFCIVSAYNLDYKYPIDCNIAIAEAVALLNGLKLASDNNIRLNLIQGRNVEVRDRVLGIAKRPPKFEKLTKIINEIKSALLEQEFDLEDPRALELVDEEDIQEARELATYGGSLVKEAMVYKRVQDLPPRVARLVNGTP